MFSNSYSGKQISNQFQFNKSICFLIIIIIIMFIDIDHDHCLLDLTLEKKIPRCNSLDLLFYVIFLIKQGLHTNINLIMLLFSTSYDCSLFLHYFVLYMQTIACVPLRTITAHNTH